MAWRSFRHDAEALAAAFLGADAWTAESLCLHGAYAFDESPDAPWLLRTAATALTAFADPPRSRFRELWTVLTNDLRWHGGRLPEGEDESQLDDLDDDDPALPPEPREGANPTHGPKIFRDADFAMGERAWPVPPFATVGDLATWLGVTPNELLWFADPRGLERRVGNTEALRHYRYRWLPKATGGIRLLETPKPRLKAFQRRLLREILDHVPAHDAAHAFRRGRSALTHASPHAGAAIVARLDLANFFLTVPASRVTATFHAMGYPSGVAWALACITTNVTPRVHGALALLRERGPLTAPVIADVRDFEARSRTRHLPQGAPTSPSLANLAAYGLDLRLRALTAKAGGTYSRYADDLAFSGDARFARGIDAFLRQVIDVVDDEGFLVNLRKTRIMRRGARQSLTGLVVNERPTIARSEIERLEAILYNCARTGPATQNRSGRTDYRAHLHGKVGYVKSIDPRRARRLEELFAAIPW